MTEGLPSLQLLSEFLDSIQKLSEDEVRDNIVRPYLEAIGANFVISPSGTNERGKDLYYRLENRYGEQELHACQVKNKPFNAQASSNSSVQTALNQISQALNSTIVDPETGQHVLPRFVTFVNTYELPDRGLENLAGYLDSLRQRSSFICGLKFARQVFLRANHVFSTIKVDPSSVWERLAIRGQRIENRAFGLRELKEECVPYVTIGLIAKTVDERLQWSNGLRLRNMNGCVLPSHSLRRNQMKVRFLCSELSISPPFVVKNVTTTEAVKGERKARETTVDQIHGQTFTNDIVNRITTLQGKDFLEMGIGALEALAELSDLMGNEGMEHCGEAKELAAKLTFKSHTAEAMLDASSSILLTGVAGAGNPRQREKLPL